MCSEEGVAVNVFTWKAQKSHNILDLFFFTRQRDALLQLQIPLIPVLISYVAAKLSFCRSCFSMMCHSYYCSDELLAPREKNCHSSVLFFFPFLLTSFVPKALAGIVRSRPAALLSRVFGIKFSDNFGCSSLHLT